MSENNGVEKLAQKLLEQINTTSELKKISVALETLSQSKNFKSHANDVVNDKKLTDSLKKTQIIDLFSDFEIPLLQTFFRELLGDKEFWLFDSDKFDYFDEFVQKFQLLTEKVMVINVVAAVEVLPIDLTKMAKDLSKALDKQVIIHLQVDPKIMGGAKIRVGNLIFDYSLRSKFSQFERQWISQLEKTSEMVGE
ncbi:F0F1 ATP synthase subunit delta [Candidatus Beckwithbacteria bacterium]|nr:F0F1 ATP synthase subunit delta [Candidatus Beckwithbacteria bacterium]